MRMKHLFIINPAAGSHDRTEEYTAKIRGAFQNRQEEFRIEVSGAPGDCEKLTRQAVASGEEYRIYACGGDGTLNEVVQGAAGCSNVAVTAFSGGSGTDFTKMFDQPEAFFDIERLLDAQEASFDLILCNGDYSLNICSVGLDARIAADVAGYKRLPLLQGFRAYVLSTILNTIKGVSEHYIVKIGDRVIDAKQTLICACNGRYYGGGFNPVPDADPTDGLMDVLLIKKVSRLKLATVIGKYKKGQYRQLADLVEHVKTDKLQILCDQETPISLDGELRISRQADISVAKEKVRFFYPKGLVWEKEAALAK